MTLRCNQCSQKRLILSLAGICSFCMGDNQKEAYQNALYENFLIHKKKNDKVFEKYPQYKENKQPKERIMSKALEKLKKELLNSNCTPCEKANLARLLDEVVAQFSAEQELAFEMVNYKLPEDLSYFDKPEGQVVKSELQIKLEIEDREEEEAKND